METRTLKKGLNRLITSHSVKKQIAAQDNSNSLQPFDGLCGAHQL